MTPNEIILKAQKRVGTQTLNIDWNGFYGIVIDEIFTEKEWRFARREINVIHFQGLFDKQFNAGSDEISLNKPITVFATSQFALVGGVPIPAGGTVYELEYMPYSTFIQEYPDHTQPGLPLVYTILADNDGISGIHWGVYPIPSDDMALWVWGDFIPAYTIDNNPMPILPKQFHRIVLDGLIMYAAEEAGKDSLSNKAERRFRYGISKLDAWDRKVPASKPRFRPYMVRRIGPKLVNWPSNF